MLTITWIRDRTFSAITNLPYSANDSNLTMARPYYFRIILFNFEQNSLFSKIKSKIQKYFYFSFIIWCVKTFIASKPPTLLTIILLLFGEHTEIRFLCFKFLKNNFTKTKLLSLWKLKFPFYVVGCIRWAVVGVHKCFSDLSSVHHSQRVGHILGYSFVSFWLAN